MPAMKKALLLIICIATLPVVSFAESVNLLSPVSTSPSINDISGTLYTSGHTIQFISNSGFGLGLTQLNWKGTSDNTTINTTLLSKKINFTAIELSYTLGYFTLGLGIPISGSKQKNDRSGGKNIIYNYKVSGSTSFATLALNIFDKGSFLLGYHLSSLKFSNSTNSESGTISNIMLGFRIPI